MKFLDKDKICDVNILFEDNHLCVVIKPSGMVVPIENDPDHSLEGEVKQYYQQKLGKETIFLRPIHRLDKPVCGIVVFARSSKALRRLHEAQRNKAIQKYYVACVEGCVKKHAQTLNHLLVHDSYQARVDQKEGKPATLKYRCVKKQKDHSLLAIRLMTGRYHQIRVQLKELGHPIVGDHKYGSSNTKQKTILLCHTKMIFDHPVTQKKLVLKWRPNFLK